jgi:glycosyltransferase involved in cell wall biosynthesis
MLPRLLSPPAVVRASLLRFRLSRAQAALNELERTPWPSPTRQRAPGTPPRVGVVAVNFNTRQLVAQLVFSLYRLLGGDEFEELVIVDNGSTDGSVELLQTLDAAQLVHLIRNPSQRYHGPALTQGVSWLAERQHADDPESRLDYVWVVDSDIVVLRPDTVHDAVTALEAAGAAAVGQKVLDAVQIRLPRHSGAMLHPSSLIFDPALIWRSPIPPFVEDGAPALALQFAADEQGLRLLDFPFVEHGYLVHLGRGTLREIADTDDRVNRYYRWAAGHRDYHFGGHPSGSELYRRFGELFRGEVGELSPERLVAACQEPHVLALD